MAEVLRQAGFDQTLVQDGAPAMMVPAMSGLGKKLRWVGAKATGLFDGQLCSANHKSTKPALWDQAKFYAKEPVPGAEP